MQILFFMWDSAGALVRVEVLERAGGVDVNATARVLMRELWDSGAGRVSRCTIYLVNNCKLALAGEENYVGTGV